LRLRPRSLVRRDLDPIGLTSLPSSISLSPGLLQIQFTTVEQLAEAMYSIARVLESEGDAFAIQFERKGENDDPLALDLS
jgi:hypothetical protein